MFKMDTSCVMGSEDELQTLEKGYHGKYTFFVGCMPIPTSYINIYIFLKGITRKF